MLKNYLIHRRTFMQYAYWAFLKTAIKYRLLKLIFEITSLGHNLNHRGLIQLTFVIDFPLYNEPNIIKLYGGVYLFFLFLGVRFHDQYIGLPP